MPLPQRFFAAASPLNYTEMQEPAIAVDESQIGSDNRLFEIVHKRNTLKGLLDYYRSQEEQKNMPLLHRSVLLQKLLTLAKNASGEDKSTNIHQARETADQIASLLFSSVAMLDQQSLLQTLKVIAYQAKDAPVRITYIPTATQLQKVEEKVLHQMSGFMQAQNAATMLSSLVKLGHFPRQIFEQLNLQANFSTFNKEDCLRLLETL